MASSSGALFLWLALLGAAGAAVAFSPVLGFRSLQSAPPRASGLRGQGVRPLLSSRSRGAAPGALSSSEDSTTHYQALGVTQGCPDDEIRRAYLKLAKQLHPDVCGGDKDKVARFQRVTAAYEELSDLQRRAMYDMALAQRAAARASWRHSYNLATPNLDDDAPPSRFFIGALFVGMASAYKAVWHSVMGGNKKVRERRERRRRRRG